MHKESMWWRLEVLFSFAQDKLKWWKDETISYGSGEESDGASVCDAIATSKESVADDQKEPQLITSNVDIDRPRQTTHRWFVPRNNI